MDLPQRPSVPAPTAPRPSSARHEFAWRPPARARRRWLQPLLLGLTGLTLSWSGGVFWNQPRAEDLQGLGILDIVATVLRAGIPYALSLLTILASHEMGHYLACRYYGIPATLPFFLPAPPPLIIGTFGAVIRIRGAIPHRRALFDVAAAGPIAGFLALMPFMIVGLLQAEPFVPPPSGEGAIWYFGDPMALSMLSGLLAIDFAPEMNSWIGAAWVGMLVTSLNLFPVGQLDGGHVAYAISRRLHRVLTWATLLGLATVILVHFVSYGLVSTYILWFGILLWMRDRHPQLQDESTPLGFGRKLVAGLLLVLFVLTFMFLPIRIVVP